MEEDNFDIVKAKDTPDMSMVVSLALSELRTTQRKEVIDRFAMKDVDPRLVSAVDFAKKNLTERMGEAGITLVDEQFPEVVFIKKDDAAALTQEIAPYGGGDFTQVRGSSNVFNDAVVVFVDDSLLMLDQAGLVFHEMYHFVGRQVVAFDSTGMNYSRAGLEIFNKKSQYNPWILEEGFVSVETARFVDTLAWEDRRYGEDVEFRKRLLFESEGHHNMIVFPDGREIEQEFCAATKVKVGEQVGGRFEMRKTDAWAGSFVRKLIDKIDDDFEKIDFIHLLRQARIDTKLVKDVAKKVDEVLGKGAYADIIRCERTDDAAWGLIQKYFPPQDQS